MSGSIAKLTGASNYFEDFEVGAKLRHARGTTIGEMKSASSAKRPGTVRLTRASAASVPKGVEIRVTQAATKKLCRIASRHCAEPSNS